MMVVTPLLYEELQDDELKSQFDQIFNAIKSIDSNSSEAEMRHRVCREVTAKPILARINKGNLSLLYIACAMLDELFHPTIKCLIEINPSALLGESELRADSTLVHYIAVHPTHYVLMPWIAANYQWVLDHEKCLEGHPPVFDSLIRYVKRKSEREPKIIQQFFGAYPQGLTQVNDQGHTPLHAILFGSAECKPDLLKWMAEQCPSNMLKKDRIGCTPLHIACWALTQHKNHSSEMICKYLITKCPKSVRIMSEASLLPIYFLLQHCQHQPVKEVVVCLLREYPESYNIPLRTAIGDVYISSISFIKLIKPLLDEERELKENIVHLQELSGMFQDAVKGTENPSLLASSTCDAFSNWATITFVERLEAMLEQALTELQDECDEEEEQDSDHETDE